MHSATAFQRTGSGASSPIGGIDDDAPLLRAARFLLEKLLGGLPVAAVLLDAELRVIWHTQLARELCLRWGSEGRTDGDGGETEIQVPSGILASCHSIKAAWSGVVARDRPRAEREGICISHTDTPQLRASISLWELDSSMLSPLFLVRIEDGHRPAAIGPAAMERLKRLSACEREVALLVCQGFSNDEIAQQLGKSVLTVKKQLRAIFQKLHVTSRARLCALMR